MARRPPAIGRVRSGLPPDRENRSPQWEWAAWRGGEEPWYPQPSTGTPPHSGLGR